MSWTSIRFVVRAALLRRRLSDGIDRELREHLDRRIQNLMEQGLSAREAHRQARLRFGDFEATRLLCHELYLVEPRKGDGPVADFIHDVRYAARTLVRSPGFTIVVTLTLALGIGANTALFSVVDGILLSPLPYPDADRLLVLSENDRLRGTIREGFSLPDYFDVVERSDLFDAVIALQGASFTLTGDGGDPQQARATIMSHNGLGVLGGRAVAGRGFIEPEGGVGGPPVAVLSHRLWMSRYGGDATVIGRSILLDGSLVEVVGVMEAGFIFPASDPDMWLPLQRDATTSNRGTHGTGVLARLKRGATLDQANVQLASIAAALEREFPSDNQGRGMWAQTLYDATVSGVRPALLTLLAAVGMVLLIACVNVANLLYARATERHREVAIRASLGANRGRLVRQLLAESAVLSGMGGAAGLGLAVLAVAAFRRFGPATMPRMDSVVVDIRILAFALVLSMLTGFVFGLLPALQVTSVDLTTPLKDGTLGDIGGRGKRGLRAGLVVAEIAMAVTLTTGAGLLIRSFWHMAQVDPGFQAAGVYTVSVALPAGKYPQARANWPEYPEVRQFHAAILDRVRVLPGVEAAALALNNPTAAGWTTRFQIAGRPEVPPGEQEEIRVRTVSPGYFETVRIAVVRGRALAVEDNHPNAPPVIVINEAAVRRYFQDEDPLGATINFWGGVREVVGVVRDVKFTGIEQETPPAVYPTFAQMPWPGFQLLVRATIDTERLASGIRTVVGELDSDLPVPSIVPLEDLLEVGVAQPRFNMMLLAAFAGTALLLSAVGIYGVMAYTVSRRTQEIGVRLSLGARPTALVTAIVRQGLGLTGIGVVLGLGGAAFATRLMANLLFGVGRLDIATFATVAAVGFAVALAATAIPAARASRVSPVEALKG